MEKNILAQIANNPTLFAALKEVLEKQFSFEGVSNQMTNENIGQVVRSRIDGLILVRNAFAEIERYKSVEEKPPEKMPAR